MFYAGTVNFRINPDFRIENFHFLKHEISLLHLFTVPSFSVKSSYLGYYIHEPEISIPTHILI